MKLVARASVLVFLFCSCACGTASPLVRVEMDSACGTELTTESAATIGSILISETVGAVMNAAAGYVGEKAKEKIAAGSGHFGSFYYKTGAPPATVDLNADTIRPTNKYPCIKVAVGAESQPDITLSAKLEFSPDGSALRLMPETVTYQRSPTGLGKSTKRNLEISFLFQVPDAEGPKTFGVAALQFKHIDTVPHEFPQQEIDRAYSYWMFPAPVSDGSRAQITAYASKQSEAVNHVWKAIEKKQLHKQLSGSADPIPMGASVCGDLAIVEDRLAGASAAKSATEAQKEQAGSDRTRLAPILAQLAIDTAEYDHLVACRDYKRARAARNQAHTQIKEFAPFDVTVTVFESSKKPVLSFIASVLGDEELQKAVADKVSDSVIDSRRESIEETENKAKLDALSAFWDAESAAEQAISAYDKAAAGNDVSEIRSKEIAMQLAKRKANKAALLAGLPQPYPEEAITL